MSKSGVADHEVAHPHTGEDYQVDPIGSEESSLYDDDEKQLVSPLH